MASVNLPRLIVAASDSNADIFYATKFRVPDPFLFLDHHGRTYALLSDLEVDRGRREARVDEVVSYSEVENQVRGKSKNPPSYARVAAAFLHRVGVKSVQVPSDFPLGLAADLAKLGLRLKPVTGSFWPQREIKSSSELQSLVAATRMTEAAMQRAWDVLRASKIRKSGDLIWSGGVLTSERLRTEIESVVLQLGGVTKNDTIVACGEQACDPHERGHGPLRAHQLIIIDIFPRDASSGYFGDLTRTVVRGRATDAQRHLWETCLHGQKLALSGLSPGADGDALQQRVRTVFSDHGYPTEQRAGRWVGFFHGLGHGLGLEIHEPPRLGRTVLVPGQVFTVEPGIYLPGVGGVRHEDVVVVTKSGHKSLTSIEKPLEI